MTVPEVKLTILADQAATPIDTARSHPQTPKTAPADLRWMRVEEFLRSREIRPNTHKAYERDLRQLMDWTDKGWHEITSRDLDRYKNHLKTEPNHRGKLRKPATINRSLAALQSFFKWLTVRDYITKNPALLLEKLQSDPVLPQEFSQDEVDNLYQAICDRGFHSFRDRALLHLIDHGLRASEIQGLNVGDYDGQRVHIRVAKADSVGTVPLLSKARKAIDQYKLWREQHGDALENESPLFVSHSNNSKGQRLQYWGIYKIFKAIADIAEVDNAHPHRGRHTLATRLVMKNMDSIMARKVTRHASEQSFVRYSDRGIELKAEQEFCEAHGEAPGGESEVTVDQSEGIELEVIVDEPATWPKITSVGMPSNAVTTVYQLKITLLGVRPQVWRRIQVPETMTLAQLHSVVQTVMG